MNTTPVPKWQFWTGWVLSGLVILAFSFAGAMKFVPQDEASKAELAKVGWDPAKVPSLGITEIACTVLYAIPQTAVLGAVLLTGYMGGAIATHARIGGQVYCSPDGGDHWKAIVRDLPPVLSVEVQTLG